MQVIQSVNSLKETITSLKAENKSIGFVPTMGALHLGHTSLIEKAKKECDIVISSIFVNPTQFNNPDDLAKYPRTLESDLSELEKVGCDIVFTPTKEEIYPSDFIEIHLDLGTLKGVMEDALRPGHFHGVVNVVKRLFELTQPKKAYFGLKDFQQVAVIKFMVKEMNLPVEIISCPTVREKSGLAMSSRNMRLNEQEKKDALIIYNTLMQAVENAKIHTPKEVKKLAIENFNQGNLKIEYIELVHPLTLETLENKWVEDATMCIAAFCGEVRLIDNMQIF